jgi:tetratricopeptide (TPR) repeat protein
MAVLLLAACAPSPGADGFRLYRAGEYARAAAAFEAEYRASEPAPLLEYNLGTAQLAAGRYDEAREHLGRAAASSDAIVQQPAFYNAGNTDLEPAYRGAPGADRAERLTRAIAAYREALRRRPADIDAKWNLELAERLLEQERQSSGGGGEGGGGGQGGGDGGGSTQQAPATANPNPAPAGGNEPTSMSPAQAEQLLGGVERDEQELQRQRLRREQTKPPGVRDW